MNIRCGENICNETMPSGADKEKRQHRQRHLAVGTADWCRGRDLVSSLRRKAEFLISALLRSSVFRGSDNTLCCHSLPLPFESSPNCIPAKRKSPRKTWTLSFWQGREDSNPRPTVLETGTLPTELHPYALVYYITYFLLLQVFF